MITGLLIIGLVTFWVLAQVVVLIHTWHHPDWYSQILLSSKRRSRHGDR